MQFGHLDQSSNTHHGVMRWNAIFAGSLVTLAIWGMLYTLGIALGLSAINPDSVTSLKASGIFTGAWSVLCPLIALFCGAVFTSRGAAAPTRAIGGMHGLVMWSLSTLGFAWLCATLLTGVIDSAVGAGKQALALGGRGVAASTQGADAMQGAASNVAEMLSNNVGIDTQDVLKAVNGRLQAAGRAPIEPGMLSQALKDLARNSLRQGRLERQDIIKVLLDNTPLERKDADELSQQFQSQIESSKASVQDALAQAKQVATDSAYKTAEVGAKAFWGIFTVLFLGMIASVGGGFIGVRDARHDLG
jgi:hypothetical protein